MSGTERVPLRVLLVEDSEDDALLVMRALRRGGYEPYHERVYSAKGMLAALRERDWDVVISDHAMPGFSAPAALDMLREDGYPDMPFIIVSGHIGEDAAVEVMKAGAHDYVPKDKLARLAPVVERALRDAEERRERRRTQEALRRAEAKYRSIFENAVEGIFQTTADGRLETVNPMMARIFGYDSPEEMMRSVRDVAAQLYVEPARRAEFTRRMLLDGRVFEFEFQAYRRDGEVIWASINARVIRDGSGAVVGYEGTLEDITERKKAEEEIRVRARQQAAVAKLGQRALAKTDLVTLMDETATTLARTLGVEYCKVLELLPSGDALILRSGVGWEEGLVGRATVGAGMDSQAGYTLLSSEPVVVEDLRSETRFRGYPLLHQHGVVSGLSVVISGRDVPFGVLSAHTRERRTFTWDDVNFLQAIANVLATAIERGRAEEALRRSLDRLVALHEAGFVLGSTLELEEAGARLLEIMRRISGFTAAAISMRDVDGRLAVRRSIGLDNLGRGVRYAPGARRAMEAAIERDATQVFAPSDGQPDGGQNPAVGLCLPLKVRERAVGVLEVYGPEELAEKDNVKILESLTNQAASAFENARLYAELAEREKRLQELVGKILVAQEEERRRVAYEVHDGLAQVAAAAHQHLQAFAHYHPPSSEEGREDLKHVSELVRQTVGEARRIIADLRPTALDDFGLRSAIRLHLDALRADGWQIAYEDGLDDERLPAATETAIFRVVQEALNNVGKHAGSKKVDLSLEKRPAGPLASDGRGRIRLKIRDYGRGFVPEDAAGAGPGERVGLTGMRERITLLGGDFRVASRPGMGTLIVAEIPLLAGPEGATAQDVVGRPAAVAVVEDLDAE